MAAQSPRPPLSVLRIAVHAVLIGTFARLLMAPAGIAPEELLKGVRESIFLHSNGSDLALVERMRLLSEQYVRMRST